MFAYRDLWPLATFTLTPLDGAEGPLIWVKVGLLTLIGVIIPLFVPRQYVPFDPKVCSVLCVLRSVLRKSRTRLQ